MSSSQGMRYVKNKRKYNKLFKNNMPEGFSTIEGAVGTVDVNEKLRNLEQEYNKVLNKYTEAYEKLVKTRI